MSEKKKSKSQKISITEGLFLGYASACTYLFAFYYEQGFASNFDIPTRLIRVSLENVLTFGTIFIGLMVVAFPLINIISLFWPDKIHPEVLYRLRPVVFVAIIAIIQILLYGYSNWKSWIFYPLLFVVYFFIEFLLPLLTQRKTKGYLNKLIAQGELDESRSGVFHHIATYMGRSGLLLVLIFFIGINLSWSVGNAMAKSQREFLVTNTSPKLVVLQIYGDYFICVPFDKQSKKVFTDFKILKMTENSNIVFSLEEIGPLKIAQNPHTKNQIQTPLVTLTPAPEIQITNLPTQTLTPSLVTSKATSTVIP
jgi:hypothetical protein